MDGRGYEAGLEGGLSTREVTRGEEMKKRFWLFFFASAGLLASAGVSVEKAVADTETQAIAKDAYVYFYAMMESYQTWRTQAVDKTANGYVGGFNVFRHYSEPFTPDNKDIVTPNNDTPAVAIRTLVDPVDPGDVEQVHVLQDAIKVNQKAAGQFEISGWDQASQKKVRDALLVLGSTIPDFKKAFGTKDQVDPVRHLIGTASAWGGNPDRDATYLNITPAKNDGTTIYKLSVKDVPVDAFWSVSVYNAEGYFEKNPYEAYSINSITGKKNTDGAIAIQFGGCDGKIANCLRNYTVRLYRPRAEILNGKWKFPEPQSAG
jgi:hypothetical protein